MEGDGRHIEVFAFVPHKLDQPMEREHHRRRHRDREDPLDRIHRPRKLIHHEREQPLGEQDREAGGRLAGRERQGLPRAERPGAAGVGWQQVVEPGGERVDCRR
jgi:hypothetical protein